MFADLPDSSVVRVGTWLYAGAVPTAVRITRSDVLNGTGDHEDPPELREDTDVECYYILFESPPSSGKYPAGGGAELTLEAAMNRAEKLVGRIDWHAMDSS